MDPPFTPNVRNLFEYVKQLTEEDTEEDIEKETYQLLDKQSIQKLFKNYDFQKKKLKLEKENVRKKSNLS